MVPCTSRARDACVSARVEARISVPKPHEGGASRRDMASSWCQRLAPASASGAERTGTVPGQKTSLAARYTTTSSDAAVARPSRTTSTLPPCASRSRFTASIIAHAVESQYGTRVRSRRVWPVGFARR